MDDAVLRGSRAGAALAEDQQHVPVAGQNICLQDLDAAARGRVVDRYRRLMPGGLEQAAAARRLPGACRCESAPTPLCVTLIPG
jgi:hypothetical protein